MDSITTHIDEFVDQQKRECARFHMRPATSETIRRRTVAEYQNAEFDPRFIERARQTFLDRGLQNVVVVRPRIDVSEFPEAAFREPKFRVSFVGLLEPWEGLPLPGGSLQFPGLPDSELVFWGASGSRAITRYIQAS